MHCNNHLVLWRYSGFHKLNVFFLFPFFVCLFVLFYLYFFVCDFNLICIHIVFSQRSSSSSLFSAFMVAGFPVKVYVQGTSRPFPGSANFFLQIISLSVYSFLSQEEPCNL